MDLWHPFRVITPTVDGEVLAVLAGATTAFTAPQVHALIGRYSESGVRNTLQRLRREGIVLAARTGQAWSYELNRRHLAAPQVVAIAGLRAELIERIRTDHSRWSIPAPFAAVFGSTAVGPMRTDSDVDLFVVRSDDVPPDEDIWRSQLDNLSESVTAWTGNDARVLEFGESEVISAIGSGTEPVLEDILDHGVVVAGPDHYLSRIGTA